jgi:CheY-like chemotaxis protein
MEGLEKAANEKPDLILLDTNMPVMSGHDMLERLREQPELKDIPVIMVTVVCEPQDIAIASSYGVVDYVTKPFDFTDLIEKIANALKNKKVLQLNKTNS